eukprot:CAMPEP_0180048838 /NCGR_PEP_ID=MMETSP0984-20121128/38513_1 /TAXON_ID=483367 /ORGANISM="non described non described, Strain CCMP 2436" /LENGTH=178 /DNA_ID=CAMNT_0021977785 /DNA_START=230 /DNA_END=768 /DNA_ORIENTATION=-
MIATLPALRLTQSSSMSTRLSTSLLNKARAHALRIMHRGRLENYRAAVLKILNPCVVEAARLLAHALAVAFDSTSTGGENAAIRVDGLCAAEAAELLFVAWFQDFSTQNLLRSRSAAGAQAGCAADSPHLILVADTLSTRVAPGIKRNVSTSTDGVLIGCHIRQKPFAVPRGPETFDG